jgi:hypothetical protein
MAAEEDLAQAQAEDKIEKKEKGKKIKGKHESLTGDG